MADENEASSFSYFSRYDEYERLLNEFLPLCEEHLDEQDDKAVRRSELFRWLTVILDYYQDQSYLLDPYLERMVSPAIRQFQERAARVVKESSKEPFPWIAHLIYHLIKTRGSKTLVRYFPHSTTDLEIAIRYINSKDATPTWAWEVRYVTLLWLSLVVILPFDLAQFDDGNHPTTFEQLEGIAYAHLGKAGLEREGSAILLAHLYARKDCTGSFRGFIQRTIKQLDEGCDDFFALGALQVAGEMAKAGTLTSSDLTLLENLIARVRANAGLISKVIVRKWICKLITRTSISVLPSRGPGLVRRSLASMGAQASDRPVIDEDVPEAVEAYLEIMIEYLQDRDSIIRWSAAKGIARISEQLPTDFSDQILETILSLFTIHFNEGNTAMHELSVMAEPVWHGAALACAEMARRGLVHENHLAALVNWAGKGLSFDIRKGSHSIGSNVRDAICYVYWALARAEVGHLLRPFAIDMARKMVIAALFDREVHVRRAASAAFQENVGRINQFPHGIPIVAKADFFAVSVRASAFTIAAPEVARYEEYQECLIHHLLSVTLKHWDVNMRQLAAVSLRRICEVDIRRLGRSSVVRAEHLLRSFEVPEVHGGLLALSELAASFKVGDAVDLERERLNVFKMVVMLPHSTFSKYRNELILEASCQLLANAVSIQALESSEAKTSSQNIIEAAMKKADPNVQDAAAQAMRAVSMISDCSADVERLIQGYRQSTPAMQQSSIKVLGALDYHRQQAIAIKTIEFLLQALHPGSGQWSANFEARKYSYEAFPSVLEGLGDQRSQIIPFDLSQRAVGQLILGLSDYTNDRRGDVGSWIRIASIRSLKTVLLLYAGDSSILQAPEKWIPPLLFQSAVSGILKQSAERLDNVRLVAVEALVVLSKVESPKLWTLKDFPDLTHTPDASPESDAEWGTARWLFPKIMPLLEVPEYRQDLLMGFLLSIGSINDTAKQAASKTLIAFAGSKTSTQKTILVESIIAVAEANMSSNQVCIPVLQALTILLDSGTLSSLEEVEEGRKCIRSILALVTWNTDKLKSIQRVSESSKILSRLLGLSSIALDAANSVSVFLGHQFPTVRATTAESMYICLQELDFEEDDTLEDVLLQTSWTDPPSQLVDAINTVTERLRSVLR